MTDTPTTARRSITVSGLVLANGAEPINIQIQPGELTGLAGLERGGQEQFLRALVGVEKPIAGEVRLEVESNAEAEATVIDSMRSAYANGIAYLPRERRTEGILTRRSVLDNFSILTRHQRARFGFISRRATQSAYSRHAERLRVKAASSASSIGTLSGGNQQKVLIARLLEANPSILLLNDPTRGVDHRTRVILYELFGELAAGGCTVVSLSSELGEIVNYCQRALIFRNSELAGDLAGDAISDDAILAAMFGSKQ